MKKEYLKYLIKKEADEELVNLIDGLLHRGYAKYTESLSEAMEDDLPYVSGKDFSHEKKVFRKLLDIGGKDEDVVTAADHKNFERIVGAKNFELGYNPETMAFTPGRLDVEYGSTAKKSRNLAELLAGEKPSDFGSFEDVHGNTFRARKGMAKKHLERLSAEKPLYEEDPEELSKEIVVPKQESVADKVLDKNKQDTIENTTKEQPTLKQTNNTPKESDGEILGDNIINKKEQPMPKQESVADNIIKENKKKTIKEPKQESVTDNKQDIIGNTEKEFKQPKQEQPVPKQETTPGATNNGNGSGLGRNLAIGGGVIGTGALGYHFLHKKKRRRY